MTSCIAVEFDEKQKRLTLSNGGVRYILGEQSPGRFGPLSWMEGQREYLAEEQPAWFAFALDGKVYAQDVGEWTLVDQHAREMANGGQEISLEIQGKGENAPARVMVQIRMNEASVLKQRFILLPSQAEKARLNFAEGKPFLRLAGHRLAADVFSSPARQALNLAYWMDKEYYNCASGKLTDNHAYFPRFHEASAQTGSFENKGPILFIEGQGAGWLHAYEHGSWDNDPTEDYFHLVSDATAAGLDLCVVAHEVGAFLDGEVITSEKPYTTVWCDLGGFSDRTPREALFDFVHSGIAEFMESRKPIIYYNTYGDQCDAMRNNVPITQRVTEATMYRHMRYAGEMGCTHFVIDYGWETDFGEWRINRQRFPGGLRALVDECRQNGMELGLWMEPLSVNMEGPLARQHPEVLVREADGTPKTVNHLNQHIGFGCLSSGYFELIQNQHCELIDAGVTFFKWDWILPDPCYSPDHEHGDASHAPEDRKRRAMFRSIERLAALAESLSQYNPKVVVEFDVTEARRQVGLQFLAASKYFWYNFGSQGHQDPMSPVWLPRELRKFPAAYGSFLPPVLFHGANAPFSEFGTRIMRYNVDSTILGMGGFWGNPDKSFDYDRGEVKFIVDQYRALGDVVCRTPVHVEGGAGASPESYEYIRGGAGQVIVFTEKAGRYSYHTRKPVELDSFFLVADTGYHVEQDGRIVMDFPMAEWSSGHGFIWDRQRAGITLPVLSVPASSSPVFRWGCEGACFFIEPYDGNESCFRLRVDASTTFDIRNGKEYVEISREGGVLEFEVRNIALARLEIYFGEGQA